MSVFLGEYLLQHALVHDYVLSLSLSLCCLTLANFKFSFHWNKTQFILLGQKPFVSPSLSPKLRNMDSSPTGIFDFHQKIRESLRAIFDPNVIEHAIVVLGELGIDSVELVAGLTTHEDESFKECILETIFQAGKAVQGFPMDKVLQACIWIKNAGATFKASKDFTTRIEKLNRVPIKIEQPSPPSETPSILLFSNSKEGRRARCSLRGSASECASNHDRISSPRSTQSVPKSTPLVPPWGEYRKNNPGQKKRHFAELNRDKLCFETALLFYVQSRTLKTCYLTMRDTKEIQSFIKLCFSKRCKSEATIKNVCKFSKEFYEFALSSEIITPFTGEHAIVPIARWLSQLSERGPSVPRMGRYALRVFGEALGVEFPIDHPAVIAATRTPKSKPTKHAPPITTEFIVALENAVSNEEFPYLKRLFCALALLRIYASLRYADTKQVYQVFVTNTALCGVSVDPKSTKGDVMQWAAPLDGLTDVKWWSFIVKHWDAIKPGDDSNPSGSFSALYPWVDKNWMSNTSRKATLGSTQAALTRLGKSLGFNTGIRAHSPRSWYATIARQLLYSREDREKLGHWAPGSLMPELYDRATCATELRLRDEILSKIKNGFKPSGPFEVVNKNAANADAESSDASSTSVVSTDEGEFSEVDIADLSDVLGSQDTQKFV